MVRVIDKGRKARRSSERPIMMAEIDACLASLKIDKRERIAMP
jgi:hypothetical protein